jgi:hypothetical protein
VGRASHRIINKSSFTLPHFTSDSAVPSGRRL